jgi:hypothetical protein
MVYSYDNELNFRAAMSLFAVGIPVLMYCVVNICVNNVTAV